jgi:histone-lysine N-methyltransferase SETD3
VFSTIFARTTIKTRAGSGRKRQLKSFLSWFESIGGQADHITLEEVTPTGKLGIVALSGIEAEQQLMTIPMDYIIWEQSIRARLRDIPYPAVKTALRSLKSDDDLMTLFLMYEASKGNQSEWFPYLQLLPPPDKVHLPVFFNERELLALQDNFMISAIRSQQDRMNHKYHLIKPAVLNLFAHVKAEHRAFHVSQENWIYWEMIVGSRALIIKGRRYLVPFADMFNYQSQRGDQRANSYGEFFLHYHRIERGFFRVLADRATVKQTEVFEDYGDNPNNVYLQHHGFVPENNPFDCIRMPLPVLQPRDYAYEVKAKLLASHKFESYECVSEAGLSEATLFYLRVLILSQEDIKRCIDLLEEYGDDRAAAVAHRCVSTEHDTDIYQHVHLTLKSQLREYATTARDDALILKVADGHSRLLSVDISDKERLALRSRIMAKTLTRRLIQLFGRPSSSATSGAVGSGKGNAMESHIEQRERLRGVVFRFNHWLSLQGLPIQNVRADVVGNGMRLGVRAKAPIHAHEPYASIPHNLIMDAASAYNSTGLKAVFVELKLLYPQGDDFHALLFHLIWERYVEENASTWWPYLALLPEIHELHTPLYFDNAVLRELRGSSVLEVYCFNCAIFMHIGVFFPKKTSITH